MSKNLALFVVSLLFTTGLFAQALESNVPDSVRDMILRSQNATQYEQIGQMQASVQFEDFLATLTGGPQKRSQVEAALIAVLSERAELSAMVVTGQASEADLRAASEFGYLRDRLAPLLTAAELALLDARRDGPTDAQLKSGYAQEMERTAGDMTEANQELVLDTLVKHIRRSQNAMSGLDEPNLDDLIALQSRAMMAAATELQSQLTGDQQQMMMAFLNQLQMNLYKNHEMSDAPR